jgi:hypothetical protein
MPYEASPDSVTIPGFAYTGARTIAFQHCGPASFVAAGTRLVSGSPSGGALLGSAIADASPRDRYKVYDDYDEPPPYGCRRGYWARQRLYNDYGDFVGWSRPHFVCRYGD